MRKYQKKNKKYKKTDPNFLLLNRKLWCLGGVAAEVERVKWEERSSSKCAVRWWPRLLLTEMESTLMALLRHCLFPSPKHISLRMARESNSRGLKLSLCHRSCLQHYSLFHLWLGFGAKLSLSYPLFMVLGYTLT